MQFGLTQPHGSIHSPYILHEQNQINITNQGSENVSWNNLNNQSVFYSFWNNSSNHNSQYVTWNEVSNYSSSYMLETDHSLHLSHIVRVLHLIYTPVLSVIGIVGNLLCMLVLRGKQLRGVSTSHYLQAMLVAEILHLLTLLHTWINDYKMLTDTFSLSGWCQFVTLIHNASQFLSTWFVLTLVIDRFLATWFPSLESRWCNPFKAKVSVVVTCIVAVIVHVNLSIIHAEYEIGSKLYCMLLPQYVNTQQTLETVKVFVDVLLVYSVMLTLSVLIVVRGRRQGGSHFGRRHPVHLTARTASAMLCDDTSTDPRQLIMFIAFITTYLLCNLPSQATQLYFTLYNMTHHPNEPTQLTQILIHRVLIYLTYTRILTNFPLFLLSYHRFRSELKNKVQYLLNCVVCTCKLRRHTATEDINLKGIEDINYLKPVRREF